MIVLYVDDSKDDAFFFGRALKKISPATEWRHVFDTHEAKCYLRGEGRFSQRESYPFPGVIISDAKMPDGTGADLFKWVRAHSDLKELLFCLFTELEENVRRELGEELAATVCLFRKPSQPSEWPAVIERMLRWHSEQ